MTDAEVNLQSNSFQNWAIKYNISASSIPNFNFLPTTSALDIGRGNTTLTLANYQARYIGGTPPVAPLNSPFVNFTTAFNQVAVSNGTVNNNENHIQISPRNGNWVVEELNGDTNVRTDCSVFCFNGVITGSQGLCNTETYTAPLVNGATYTWFVDNPSIVNTQQNGNSYQISKHAGALGTLTITVQITGACGTTTITRTIQLGVNVTRYIYGPASVSCNDFVNYFTSSIPGASYQWSFPGDWIYISGQGTSSINLQTPGSSFGDVSISVVISDVCGNNSTYFYVYSSCYYYYYTVSPNPASSTVTVSAKGTTSKGDKSNKSITEINFYDQQGNLKKYQKLSTGIKTASFNVSDLNTGIYIIEILDGDFKERQKLSVVK